MNIKIKSLRDCRSHARTFTFRHLAMIATIAALVASGSVFAQPIYWLSGTASETDNLWQWGSWERPKAALPMSKNEMVILDANPVPGIGAYTPVDAIDPNINFAAVLTNAANNANSAYMGWKAGDPLVYHKFTPYVRLNGLMTKTPWLETLMPSFFTQSERVYLAGPIGQNNNETPDNIKAVTSNPFNVWPLSVYSSDALKTMVQIGEDGVTVTGTNYVPRPDMQNAAWVILASAGESVSQRQQLMNYYGEYVPATGGGTRPWDGSYSMITLEHVIFYGGKSNGSGGAIDFKRSDGLPSGSNSRAILQIKGDVAFVNNMASQLGGGINAQDSIQFDGNVYFVGNQTGVGWYDNEDMAAFNRGSTGGSNYDGDGGAIRAGSGGKQTLTFKKDAIFIGNLAADMGGVLSTHNDSTFLFQGKSVFMGNQAGLLMRPGTSLNGGNGGAIVIGSNGSQVNLDFSGESYFIANSTSGFGGVLASGNGNQDNFGRFMFSADALFTDNISGVKPEVATIYSDIETQTQGGSFLPPQNLATASTANGIWSGTTIINVFSGTLAGNGENSYGAKIRGGGVFYGYGTLLFFDEKAQATILRNSTNGSGGALYLVKNSTSSATGKLDGYGALFYNNATFTGNVAAINGGAISAGTYGSVSDILLYGSGTAVTSAAVYFGKAGGASTLTMHGNIAYTAPETLTTPGPVTTSGSTLSVVLSTGTTVRAGNGTTVHDIPVFGGGAVFSVGGLYVESLYSFKNNQTGGSGGAILIGSGANPESVFNRMGRSYGLVLNALDWRVAGSYSLADNSTLFQDNVAVRDGGAIAIHDGASAYIGSGAKFLNNYAGGEGGAIALALNSGQTVGNLGTAILDLRARVGDIIFSGNRAGVTIDTSTVDFDKILDPLNTTNEGKMSEEGYMTVDKTSGHANDIYIGKGSTGLAANIISALINMDAYEGMKISLDGGIAMDHSGTTAGVAIQINTTLDQSGSSLGSTGTINGTNLVMNPILDNTTPTGLIVLNNASADIEGQTIIGNGTLRIQGTSNNLHWGSAANATRAGSVFRLQGPATLEANATINANSILIGDGATLRVLGSAVGSGSLVFNTGTGGVSYAGAVNLAGNGRIETGVSALTSITSVFIGDIGHASAQTLTIARDASTLASLTLNNSTLALGLFAGNTSDKLVARDITLTGANRISLTSVALGVFDIATANGTLSDSSTWIFDYKGTQLTSGGRMTFSVATSGNNLQLTYTTSNLALDWNGASGDSWTLTSGKMTSGDTNYVLGDIVNFGSGAAKTVFVDENVLVSGMTVAGDYTFAGSYGIMTDSEAWTAAANAAADGRLTMNATGKTLTLANATGAGQRNEFTGGILIQGGTVAAGNAAQLGAALSQITFANATNNGAALLVTGEMLLDGAVSLASQQLAVGSGIATVATTVDGIFTVANNTVTGGNGGVFNVGANGTLNLTAQGDMRFLNNRADQGGALALGDNARANIDVADGRTVMFGLQSDRMLKTAVNTSEADSIYGAASSVIEKTGAGVLSINSLSDGFAGTLNVNAGGVVLGEGAVFGSAASRVNVVNGAVFGGAATIGGDVTVNGGRLAVDGGRLFGRTAWTAAQTMTILGSLDLTDASLFFNSMNNRSKEFSVDLIKTGGDVNIAGITQFDFALLANTTKKIVDAGSNAITWADTAGGVVNDTFVLSGGIFETSGTIYNSVLLNSNTTWSGQTFVTSHTIPVTDVILTDTNFVLSKNGAILDASRYEAIVGYELINSVVVTDVTGEITGTIGAFISQTNFYDASGLTLESVVNNMKVYWTGASTNTIQTSAGMIGTSTLWNSEHDNWNIPLATSDKTFADGDSLVFGARDDDGNLYDGGNEIRRTITVEPSAAFVADMTFTGSDNWTFMGGMIVTNAGGNRYKDENGVDLSTGQMLLDESFTGTVTLLNDGIQFNGIYVDTGSSMTKTADVAIKNGTLVGSAGVFKGNLIENNSLLIFEQGKNEDFADTRVYGEGRIIQRGDSKITMKETGIIKIGEYQLQEGSLSVDFINSLQVSGTFFTEAGATLLLKQGMTVGTLVNRGVLTKAPYSSDSPKPPTGPDPLRPREPGIGLSTSTILLNGNYVSEGGTLELATYRDGIYMNNLFITGNASGTSKVVIRNITSMDSAATTTGTVFGTGTYFMPTGQPASINPLLVARRDTPVTNILGAQRDLTLVMDWDNSILPSATVGSIVPFLTWTNSTYVVTTSSTITTTLSGTVISSSTLTSSSTESLSPDTKQKEYYDRNGSVAQFGTTGSATLGSGTIMTSGSLVESGTTTVIDIIVVSNTYAVRSIATTYGESTIDYSESPDNYKLVQGRDGNWYFRNNSIGLRDVDLPMIGAAPIMADMLAQGSVKAFYQHVNARHDALEEGWSSWTNYTHSEDRLRKDYYDDTMIKQDIFQVGMDYAFIAKDVGDYSLAPSISFGGAIAFTKAEATRNQTTTNVEILIDGTNAYTHTAKSTLSADTTTFNAYASARWWRLYLDVIAQYGINATYKTRLDASVPFDMDGQIKGSRIGASAEFGVITNPPGLGQLEIYVQATGQKHDFGTVSSITEPAELTNPDGYNGIYDPNSSNGRRYRFTAPTTFRAEAGLRWGSHLKINEDLAVRPWGGIAYGRMMSSDYLIYVDNHSVRNDMRGNYYTFQGGAAAVFRRNWQFYFTLGWSGGEPTNNYTLSTGVSRLW